MPETAKRLQLDKAGLFEALGYEPHAGQWLVHRSTAPRRVLACGVRWGKTTCAQFECVAALLEPRHESIGWVVGPDYGHSERIFSKVALAMQKHFSHRVKTLDLREQRLVVINFGGGTSELRGKSADNPVSLLGEGLSFMVVDEAARLKEAIWHEHLSQRLIDRRGWALLLSTPKGAGWFLKLYRRGQKNRDPHYESWQSPSWTNPHLDRQLIEDERARMSEDTFAEQFEAAFLGAEEERCDVCGCPDPKVPALIWIKDGDEFPTCPECGDWVDSKGHTVVSVRGRHAYVRVLVSQPRSDGTEPEVEVRQPPVMADDAREVRDTELVRPRPGFESLKWASHPGDVEAS